MAIYGDLEDHALIDLAAVLRNRSGTLFFHKAYRGRTVELTLAQGVIRTLYLDGFPVKECRQLHDVFDHLVHEKRGAFEFDVKVNPAGADVFDLRLEDLVRQATLSASVPEEQLPGLATLFVRVPGATPPAVLLDSWRRLLPALGSGASAQELAQATGQGERAVREQLYQLRAAGLIVPRRAAESQALAGQSGVPVDLFPGPGVTAGPVGGPAPATPPEPPMAPLLHRMIGALRRLTGTGRA